MTSFDVVIPTAGRSALHRLLDALLSGEGPSPERVIVADDRPSGSPGLEVPEGVVVVRSGGRGPAAARNTGWRAGAAEWVAFLDDDVVPPVRWRADLARDLDRADAADGSQGGVRVPVPDRRPLLDWERSVTGLEQAHWATADMAYRRRALEWAGGFDERFPRAYREDADLALRLLEGGFRLVTGDRHVVHPLPDRPGFWFSVARQAGNADDALMRVLHGRGWEDRCGGRHGTRRRHLAVTALGAAALGAVVARRPIPAAVLGGAWLAATGAFAWRRIAAGPRTPAEVVEMAVTSAVIPPVASWHWLAGLVRARRLATRPAAVLFDRDGTLVEDVPYNGDPGRVRLRPGAREALARLRAARIPVAVVSNQSGVARGLITPEQVTAVNRRIEELAGPIDEWLVCMHGPDDGCDCRKPRPGLVRAAATRLGVREAACALIGDIGSDVEAARAAGARAILVPTAVTRAEEVAAAPEVAPSLPAAVDRLLRGSGGGR